MSLTQNQINELMLIAKEAAKKAGNLIASYEMSEVNIKSKDGGQSIASCVVTEVDLKAEQAILEILNPTLKKYDLGLLTEESTDDKSRFEKDYFWCIDPLDGTLAFTQNKDGYSTSIALVSKAGEPIIGAVYNPRNHTLYHAIKGSGAYKNDLPLKVNNQNKSLSVFFDLSYLENPQYENHIEKLKSHIKEMEFENLILNPLGGAVMNAIATIEQAPALYYKLPKKQLGGGSLWDFAASSIIQSEAGGFNSDYHQDPLDLNRKDSTFMNHKGVIYSSSKSFLKFLTLRND